MKMKHRPIRTIMQITKALADEQRVRSMMLLVDGELCVCQIVDVLGLAPSTVSKHLSILRSAGLVDYRKEGRWAFYRLADGYSEGAIAPLVKWLQESLKDDETVGKDRHRRGETLECDLEALCRHQRKGGNRSRESVSCRKSASTST